MNFFSNQKKIFILLGLIFLVSGFLFWKAGNRSEVFAIPQNYQKPLIVKTNNSDFLITPVGAQQSQKTKQAQNKYKYEDAYPETDVVQEIKPNGLKEDIVLKQPGHPEKFVYKLDLSSLDFEFDSEGNINFFKKGESRKVEDRILRIPAPYMIDSEGKESNTGDVKTTLDQNGTLTLTPDKNWLAKASYPIILDPTIELNLLTVHSHPSQGEDWVVEFTTLGRADLTITPMDQATIDDDDFVGLYCGNIKMNPEILTGDVIYYKNWQCNETARVVHYTNTAGDHTLEIDFGGEKEVAHNANWWNGDFARCKTITISNAGSTTLSNYPALIEVTHDSDMQADFDDIRFVGAACDDGGSLLDYEMDNYSSGSSAEYWVEIPSLPSTGTDIAMYYDNDSASSGEDVTGTWATAGHKMVQHLDEDPSGTAPQAINSAISSTNDCTSNGGHTSSDLNSSGKIDSAIDFDGGSGDSYSCGTDSSLDFGSATDFTLEAWVKTSASNNMDPIISKKDPSTSPYQGYELLNNWGSARLTIRDTDNFQRNCDGSAIDDGAWHYVVGVADRSGNAYIYVDTDLDNTCDISYFGDIDDDNSLDIGGNSYYNYKFIGTIDEVRVSSGIRSGDWIEQNYQMVENQSTYVSFGSEIIGNAVPTVTSVSDSPDPIGVGSEATFTVDWNDEDTGDLVQVYICKTDAYSSGCTGGEWTSTDSYGTVDPVSLTYTTVAGDKGNTRNYYVYVCDDSPACTASGTSGSFTVQNMTPDASTDILVEGMEVDTAINIVDTTPEFKVRYNDSYDEGDVADKYCIEVDTQSDFTGTQMWATDSNDCYTGTAIGSNVAEGSFTPDFSYAGTSLSLDGTVYYWRAWLWDDDGERSATSTVGWFSLADQSAGAGVRLQGGRLKGGVRLK